jgi:hypothetical protein
MEIHVRMKITALGKHFVQGALVVAGLLYSVTIQGQQLVIQEVKGNYIVSVSSSEGISVSMPDKGLWSVATEWKNDWPDNWQHASPTKMQEFGDWKILSGAMKLPEGEWHLQDAYKKENGRIKCIRRFEWHGKETLEKVTLSVRWKINQTGIQAFLPGILYYGNPSGEKMELIKSLFIMDNLVKLPFSKNIVYPMPFACLEWKDSDRFFGAALHTLPSPVSWWVIAKTSGGP